MPKQYLKHIYEAGDPDWKKGNYPTSTARPPHPQVQVYLKKTIETHPMETNSPASLQSSPDPQPSKRPQSPSPISPSSKGKAPMEEPSAPFDFNYDNNEDDSYTQARSCGICLSEEGRAVRGCIDSCDHYFCFLCIVEWSKIESRCPLCKGRFCKIRRVRKDGSFIGERDVLVPVRNQMYDPHRNVTSGPLDPYSNVSCAICTNSTDENLLLLCDLCDTAVHTYCSGLGGTIPEGDWFCQECTQMKAEELNITSPAPDHNNTEKPSVQAPRSVFDIVREPGDPDPEVSRLFSLFPPQEQQKLSTASALSGLSCQNVGSARGKGSRVCRKSETKVAVSSFRTLNQCRDANKYIRELRENWNSLRSGSISFSSRKSDSGATNNSRENQSSRGHGSNGSLRGDTPNECSYDVDRAWKMFDIAKSKKPQKSSNKSSASKKLAKVSSLKDSTNMFLGAASTSVPSKTKSSTSIGLEVHQSFKRHDKSGSIGSGKHNNGVILGREKTTICYTDMAAASSGKCTFSSKNTHKSVKNEVFHGRVIMLPQEKIGQASPRVYNEQGISSCTKSPAGLLTGASGLSCSDLGKKPAYLNPGRCSGQSIDTNSRHTSENNRLHKSAEKRTNSEDIGGSSSSKRIKVDNEAKSEIQFLVKLNLKLLSAGKKLEVDLFKDIARRSTHEILAACGLEPPRHNKLLIPKPICSHDDQNKKHSKLSLMPNSCRECFYAFVKEVVGSIVSDKIPC